MAVRLPSPMLSRLGPIPSGDYAFEVKWDGFRALLSNQGDFRVLSRPGLEHDRAAARAQGRGPLLTMGCLRLTVATHGNGFGLDFALFAPGRFANGCHQLQPRGSIKAPSR
jgi:hypothetical protein